MVRTIIETLKKAGKGKEPKPVRKEDIVALLKVKFPERNEDKMRKTVYNQVPTQIQQYRAMNVWRKRFLDDGEMGYWIPEDVKAVQPAPTPEEKKAVVKIVKKNKKLPKILSPKQQKRAKKKAAKAKQTVA